MASTSWTSTLIRMTTFTQTLQSSGHPPGSRYQKSKTFGKSSTSISVKPLLAVQLWREVDHHQEGGPFHHVQSVGGTTGRLRVGCGRREQAICECSSRSNEACTARLQTAETATGTRSNMIPGGGSSKANFSFIITICMI
jgi:hypothetical protein